MKLLYIDEQLIDLYPNTVIAQTLQVFDPGRLGSVVTNYTSSIRVPRTATNERILSFLSNSKVKSDVPYSSLSCRYEEDGISIIRNARIIINEANEKEYSLNIFSGPWGFFELIQTKKLWNLDFSDLNGPWSETTRDSYRNTTEGIIHALVDDGFIFDDLLPVIDYRGETFRPPQIYYSTVIKKIFETRGFEYTGDIFDNAIFNNIVLPLNVFYRDPSWVNAKKMFAGAPGDQVMINPTVKTAVLFTKNIVQGSDNFWDGTSEYIVSNPETALRYFQLFFSVILDIEVSGGTVNIIAERTDYTDEVLETGVGTGIYENSFSLGSLGFKDGDVARIVIIANSGTPTVTINSGSLRAYTIDDLDTPGLADDEIHGMRILESYVYFNKLFEDVNQVDFLKEFCVRFNCQITQINNVLHVNTINKILDIFTGPDWTLKRDKEPNKIKYAFSTYGKNNLIKSPIDSDYTPLVAEGFNDGQFDIPNENLKESVTVYNSLFYVSDMILTYGVYMFHLNNTELNDLSQTYNARFTGNRFFFVRGKYDFEPDARYNSVDRSDYLIGFAFDPNQEYYSGWQFFIDNFHQKFVDRCLRNVRLIERFYNLRDLDIFAFNQQVPIWDDGERFLVTKIINYVSRKLTKVELLKMESNPETIFIQGTENNISGTLEDFIEQLGNTVDAILDVQMELAEDVTGNPTWQTTWDNGSDSVITSVVGNFSTDTDTVDPHVGLLNVDADVLKTNNDGNGPDGFPTNSGFVEWLRNGVRVNTVTFDSSSHSSTQGLNYTYTDVKAWEVLKVFVHEDGTSP